MNECLILTEFGHNQCRVSHSFSSSVTEAFQKMNATQQIYKNIANIQKQSLFLAGILVNLNHKGKSLDTP
jgi:hypothetical protein